MRSLKLFSGKKWRELRGAAGPLGAKTDEAHAARGGRFNEFEHGFIYWNPSLGAHAAYGDIGGKESATCVLCSRCSRTPPFAWHNLT